MIASTGRLLIRPLSPADLPALAGILGDPEVMRYSVRGVCDAAATGRFLDWCLASYARDGIGPWALVEKGGTDLIGFCGIGQERVGEVEEINLGYRLARSCWGRGLATEAVQAVLSFALGQGLPPGRRKGRLSPLSGNQLSWEVGAPLPADPGGMACGRELCPRHLAGPASMSGAWREATERCLAMLDMPFAFVHDFGIFLPGGACFVRTAIARIWRLASIAINAAPSSFMTPRGFPASTSLAQR